MVYLIRKRGREMLVYLSFHYNDYNEVVKVDKKGLELIDLIYKKVEEPDMFEYQIVDTEKIQDFTREN
jgi:hypothetical protein